jgi:hypothetical protein
MVRDRYTLFSGRALTLNTASLLMSTETAKPAEATATATTPPTQPETKAPETKAQATEDTAMKTTETAPSKPAETATEKRKTPEGEEEENVSEVGSVFRLGQLLFLA